MSIVPVSFGTEQNVVFFGNALSVECQRCGAFSSTDFGHKYCVHVTCPIALREFKRRRRKRTSTLEQVYMPKILERLAGDVPVRVPVEGPPEPEPEHAAP